MKLISGVLAALALTGCGTIPYVQPTAGPTATIQFINDAHRNLEAAIYEQSATCKGRRQVPVVAPGSQVEQKVRADAELTFQYYLTNFGDRKQEQYCLMNLRFTPVAGRHYLFRTAEDTSFCRWAAFDDTDKEKPVKVDLTQITWKAGWDENSSWCDK
jgi:hypothetical protein